MKEIAQRKSNIYFIIIGNFNHIIQPSIDKNSRTNSNFKKLLLHSQMMKQNFINTFRELYPSKKDFIQSNGKDSTRIDQIWISDSLIFGLKKALIKEMTFEMDSNYRLVTAKILLNHLDFSNRLAQTKRKGIKRTIFLYDKATEETRTIIKESYNTYLRKS